MASHVMALQYLVASRHPVFSMSTQTPGRRNGSEPSPKTLAQGKTGPVSAMCPR